MTAAAIAGVGSPGLGAAYLVSLKKLKGPTVDLPSFKDIGGFLGDVADGAL